MHGLQISGNIVSYMNNLDDTPDVPGIYTKIREIMESMKEDSCKKILGLESHCFENIYAETSIKRDWLIGRNIIWLPKNKSWKIFQLPVNTRAFQNSQEAREIINNENINILLEKARACSRFKMKDMAKYYYSEFLKIDPENGEVLRELNAVSEKTGWWSK
jgi:hypothetical protein